MKRCNCHHPVQPGPSQSTGSMLYPDVAPRPMPITPVCPTCPPGPIPEPYPVESARKTVIVEAGDNVTVEKFDGLLDTVYRVSSTEVNDGMLSITVGENEPVEFGANEPGDVSVEIPLADEETFGLVKITDDIETEDPDAVITAVAVRKRLESVGGYKEAPRGPDGKPDVPMEDRSPNYIYLTEVPGSQGPDHYDEWIWKPGDPSAEPPTEGEWKCIGTTGGDTTDLVHKVTGGTEGNLGSLTDDGSLADSGLAGTDVEDAVAKKHEHANKDILDDVTAPYTTEEQGKLAGIEAGAQVNTVSSISVNGSAVTPDVNKNVEITVHTHENKAILDEITAPYTTEEQGKLTGIESGAQVNDIASISVNGSGVTPDANKNVNIVIPKAVPNPSAANQMLFSVEGLNGYEWSVATWEMEEFGGVTIDGRAYSTVKIGNQKWMAENLDYKFAYDGGILPIGGSTVNTPAAWYYDNDEPTYGVNGNKYGLLYNGYAANYLEANKATLLPEGWHVPTKDEIQTLVRTAGGSTSYNNNAGLKLKSTSGWINDGNGTDDYGFSFYPAGAFESNAFGGLGDASSIWSSTAYNSSQNYFAVFYSDSDHVASGSPTYSNRAYSIRLVKNID